MTIKERIIPKLKQVAIRSRLVLSNTNKPLLIVGLGFIGLALVGALFIQYIDPTKLPVGLYS